MKPVLREQLGLADAEALDVHRAAAHEVLHPPHELGRTRAVDAVGGCLARGALDRLAARGTGLRHLPGLLRAGAQLGQRAEHLGDHLARALHRHHVAGADVQLAT